jgi:hypothetical protein
VRFTRLEWVTPPPLKFGREVRVRFTVRAASAVDDLSLGIGFNLPDGSRFLTFESDAGLSDKSLPSGAERVYELTVPDFPVSPGRYGIDVGIRSGDRHMADGLNQVADVEVIGAEDTPSHIMQFENVGVRLPGEWARIAAG